MPTPGFVVRLMAFDSRLDICFCAAGVNVSACWKRESSQFADCYLDVLRECDVKLIGLHGRLTRFFEQINDVSIGVLYIYRVAEKSGFNITAVRKSYAFFIKL